MGKIGIVTDSNSGITSAQARELGISVVPMPFMIDGKTYYEERNMTQAEFYEMLTDGCEISTSQPAAKDVREAWDDALKECDELVHIPMSRTLSGGYSTSIMLAKDYGGRVEVVNNQRVAVTQRQSILDALQLAGEGRTAREIREILEATRLDSSIYVVVDTLKYLKKGGRITPEAAAIGTALHVRPILQIQGEKLDAYALARTPKQARKKLLGAMRHDMRTRFRNAGEGGVHLSVAHSQNEEAAREFAEEIKASFPGTGDVYIAPMSLGVACHIGPGSLAIASSLSIEAFFRIREMEA